MRLRVVLLLVVGGLAAASCGSGESARSECEVLHEPGEYEEVGRYGDVDQPYWMVVPADYANIAPAPLYVHLASGLGDHNGFMDGWRPYVDDLDGLMIVVNTATPSRIEPDALASLVDEVSTEYCVDARRVHVLGTATSFGVAENFACEHSGRVASFVAALGSAAGPCSPERPVPLLTFSGDTDRDGVNHLVDKWININGCDPDPVVEDLGSGVMYKTYQNCAADVFFYDIEGMGHTYPLHEAKGSTPWVTEYDEVDYLEQAQEFFAEHPLP